MKIDFIQTNNSYFQPSPGIHSLPKEVLTYLFSFLDFRSLSRASRVCRTWSLLANGQELWNSLVFRDFGNIQVVGISSQKENYHILLEMSKTISFCFQVNSKQIELINK